MTARLDRRSAIIALAGGVIAARANAQPTRLSPQAHETTVRLPDGVSVAVSTVGAPQLAEVLLIHGLGQSRLAWRHQAALADRFRLVSYDLRGHGASDKPLSATAYAQGERWADEIAGVIGASGLRRPVVVGWSLGSIALGHYLAKYGADRVAGCVFVGGVSAYSPDLFEKRTAEVLPGLESGKLADRVQAVRGFIDAGFASALDPQVRDAMIATAAMVPAQAYAGIRALPVAAEGALSKVGGRGLVIHGTRDGLVKPEMARLTASLTGARLVLMDGAGHGPMVDEPARFNAELSKFIWEVTA